MIVFYWEKQSTDHYCGVINSREGMYGTVIACMRQHLSSAGEGNDQVFIQGAGRYSTVWNTEEEQLVTTDNRERPGRYSTFSDDGICDFFLSDWQANEHNIKMCCCGSDATSSHKEVGVAENRNTQVPSKFALKQYLGKFD